MSVTKAEIKQNIELFKAEAFFPDFKPSVDVQKFLQDIGDMKHLNRLTGGELLEYAVLLSHYSLSLTIQENRIKSHITWCETNLKQIVGRLLDQSFGFTFQEKDCYIRANEPRAVQLEEIKLQDQIKLDTIIFVSQKVHFLSEMVKSLALEKNKANRQ